MFIYTIVHLYLSFKTGTVETLVERVTLENKIESICEFVNSYPDAVAVFEGHPLNLMENLHA